MKLPVVFVVYTGLVLAQSSAVVVGGGYNAFSPVSVAAGQVITIQATGVGNVTQKVTATLPLPKKLAGISALLFQGDIAIPAPILAVFPLKACPDGIAQFQCGSLTAITLQIPFELSPRIPGLLRPDFLTYLQVSDDAVHLASIRLDPQLDAIHVLHSLDTVVVQEMAQKPGSSGAVVTHADGTAVDAMHPAKVGEQLVMYAVGVGATKPPVATGARDLGQGHLSDAAAPPAPGPVPGKHAAVRSGCAGVPPMGLSPASGQPGTAGGGDFRAVERIWNFSRRPAFRYSEFRPRACAQASGGAIWSRRRRDPRLSRDSAISRAR